MRRANIVTLSVLFLSLYAVGTQAQAPRETDRARTSDEARRTVGVPAGVVPGAGSGERGRAGAEESIPTGEVQPGPDPACAAEGATRTQPGIDPNNGFPYVDEFLPDGVVRRVTESGSTIIRPTAEPARCLTILKAEAPRASPPALPADPAKGRHWIERHNEALLGIIQALTGNDSAVMDGIAAAEQRDAGDDLFKQIAYRTGIASFYAGRLR